MAHASGMPAMVRFMATRDDAARLATLLWQQQVAEGEDAQAEVLDELAELLTKITQQPS